MLSSGTCALKQSSRAVPGALGETLRLSGAPEEGPPLRTGCCASPAGPRGQNLRETPQQRPGFY